MVASNRFEQYDSDINAVWIYKLNSSFSDANHVLSKNLGDRLKPPNFYINSDIKWKWGSWSPETRTLTLALRLLRNYEWGAVERVLKHEMAHMVVSDLWEMDCYGVSHGEAWNRACDALEIPAVRCDSAELLSGFKGKEESPMADKVRKLLVKGHDESVTQKEAEVFLMKAEELMMRHDISLEALTGNERLFVRRPVGKIYKSFPAWLWRLGDLVSEHYNVQNIRTSVLKNNTRYKYLELFGEPDNLDIAEYVFHAILNQGEILFKQFKVEHNIKMKEDDNYKNSNIRTRWTNKKGKHVSVRRVSQRAFMSGLVAGYNEKLCKERINIRDKVCADSMKIVPTYNKQLLKEMYGKAYPNKAYYHSVGSNGHGREAGHKAGNGLTISKGVRSGGNRGRLLHA